MKLADSFLVTSFQKISFVLLVLGPAIISYSGTYFWQHHDNFLSCFLVLVLGLFLTGGGIYFYKKLRNFFLFKIDKKIRLVIKVMEWLFPLAGVIIGVGVNFLD